MLSCNVLEKVNWECVYLHVMFCLIPKLCEQLSWFNLALSPAIIEKIGKSNFTACRFAIKEHLLAIVMYLQARKAFLFRFVRKQTRSCTQELMRAHQLVINRERASLVLPICTLEYVISM